MNVKDLILETTETVAVDKKSPSKLDVTYSVELWDEPDLVIKRKTKTTSTLLVMLFSQGQFYIKNEKNGTVEMLDEKNLLTFCKGDSDRFRTNAWIFPKLPASKEERESLVKVLKNPEVVRFFAKGYAAADVGYLSRTRGWRSTGNWYALRTTIRDVDESYFDALAKVCREKEEKKPYFFGRKDGWEAIFNDNTIGVIKQMERVYGHPTAMEFLKDGFRAWEKFFLPISRGYAKFEDVGLSDNLKYKDLSKYLFEELPRQGFNNFSDSLTEWFDYLKMQIDVYGKIRDRYPKYLLSEHAILAQKHRIIKHTIDEKKWVERVTELSKNEITQDNKTIAPPKTKQDMLDAAKELSNCLSSYIDAFLSGRSDIYLLTNGEGEQRDIIAAIEVRKGAVVQAKERFNQALGKSSNEFIGEWAKKNSFEIQTRDVKVAV